MAPGDGRTAGERHVNLSPQRPAEISLQHLPAYSFPCLCDAISHALVLHAPAATPPGPPPGSPSALSPSFRSPPAAADPDPHPRPTRSASPRAAAAEAGTCAPQAGTPFSSTIQTP